MWDRRLAGCLPGWLLIALGAGAADDGERADAELLEYLGMWEGSDEDWMIFAAPGVDATDAKTQTDPDGDVPTESDL